MRALPHGGSLWSRLASDLGDPSKTEYCLPNPGAARASPATLSTSSPDISVAEWTMRRVMLWKGYLIWGLICASALWFIGGCWHSFKLMIRGEQRDEA